jgi:hypothetical protein
VYLNEIEWVVVDWINLTQDKDQWWVFVHIVMNIQIL